MRSTTTATVYAAWARSMVPVARVILRAFDVQDDRFRDSLIMLRRQIGDLIITINRSDDAFWRALEELIAMQFRNGLLIGEGVSQQALSARNLEEILEWSRSRDLMPTTLSSAELRQVSQEIRRNAIFSARTANGHYLAKQADVIDRYIAGRINMATARMELKEELSALGYSPEGGFPGDKGSVPPATAGSLRDLSSDARIELIIRTQADMAFGLAQKVSGAESVATFPAWELVRLSSSVVPRDWVDRWLSVGGQLRDGVRMIALKSDPIWAALGDGSRFPDALDTDHPPFAFNSGMGWLGVYLSDARELGIWPPELPAPLPQPRQRPASVPPPLPPSLEGFPPDIAEIVRKELADATEAASKSFAADQAKFQKEYVEGGRP